MDVSRSEHRDMRRNLFAGTTVFITDAGSGINERCRALIFSTPMALPSSLTVRGHNSAFNQKQ